MTSYKVGRGRGTKTVEARQYTRDQDFSLAKWIGKPVQVHRDHFRLVGEKGLEVGRASKGDWLLKDAEGEITVMDARTFSITARSTGEEI